MASDYDVIIIGAGVVGLAVARGLAEEKVSSVLIIEEKEDFGRGVSSRNSEVIHSGIYYAEGSLKARYCRLGREKLYPFCRENDVWHSQCGKLVVAQEGQEDQVQRLYRQAQLNGVPDICLTTGEEVGAMEPDVSAKTALFVGCTGIISARELMSAFSRYSVEADHDLVLKASVVGIEPKGEQYSVTVSGPGETSYKVVANWVVNAAGLASDRVAESLWGTTRENRPVLHYSKGSYFRLTSRWRNKIQHLVYPIPDEAHDSLGIHLSFDQGGDVRLGPSARWLENREQDYSIDDGDREMFYASVKRYLPGLERDDLSPDFSGIRPKLAAPAGQPSDFYIRHEEGLGYRGWINLIGIDSPGLTAAIAIGEEVAAWIAG